MPLNSSGPLSFGGSTTGQSINLELGLSATAQASIDSTAFRTLAGVLSGQISVSNFYGKSNVKGFVGFYGDYTANAFMGGTGVTVNSSGNFVMTATFGIDQFGIFIITSSTSPTVVAQAYYSGGLYLVPSPNQKNGTASPAIDSSGNIHFAGSNSAERGIWFKTDSSLNSSTPTYQFESIPGGFPTYNFRSSANTLIDSSGNVIIGFSNRVEQGSCQPPDSTVFIGKFAASGSSAVWNRTTGNISTIGGGAQQITGMALDSSQNVWATTTTNYIMFDASTGSSTGYQAGSNTMTSIAIDGSNNKYMASDSSATSNTYNFNLMKVNSSNTLLWAKALVNGTFASNVKRVIVGGDGFIYMVGSILITNDPVRYGIVVKYNSSGVLQWQRIIYNASPFGGIQQYAGLMDCAYTANGLVVTGAHYKSTNNSSPVAFVALLPLDGSGTGSYTVAGSNVTYAASSFTDATDSSVTVYTTGVSVQNASQGSAFNYTKVTPSYSVVSTGI
jgi:hypothetical protein